MLHKCLIHLFKSKHLAVVHIDIFNTALFSFVSVMFRLDPLPPAWEGGAWQGRAAGHHAQVGGGGHQARPRPPAPPLRPGVPAPDAVHGCDGLHARHVPPLPLAARGTLAQCRFVFSVTSTLSSTNLQHIIKYLHIWTFCFNCSVRTTMASCNSLIFWHFQECLPWCRAVSPRWRPSLARPTPS